MLGTIGLGVWGGMKLDQWQGNKTPIWNPMLPYWAKAEGFRRGPLGGFLGLSGFVSIGFAQRDTATLDILCKLRVVQ